MKIYRHAHPMLLAHDLAWTADSSPWPRGGPRCRTWPTNRTSQENDICIHIETTYSYRFGLQIEGGSGLKLYRQAHPMLLAPDLAWIVDSENMAQRRASLLNMAH